MEIFLFLLIIGVIVSFGSDRYLSLNKIYKYFFSSPFPGTNDFDYSYSFKKDLKSIKHLILSFPNRLITKLKRMLNIVLSFPHLLVTKLKWMLNIVLSFPHLLVTKLKWMLNIVLSFPHLLIIKLKFFLKEFFLFIGKFRFIRRYSDKISLLKFLLLFVLIILISLDNNEQTILFIRFLCFSVFLLLFFIDKKSNILKFIWLPFAIAIQPMMNIRYTYDYWIYLYITLFIVIVSSIRNSNKHIS
jgi:hypothetical protein